MNALTFWSNAVAEAFREHRTYASGTVTVQQYAKRELRALRLVRFWRNTGQHHSPASERAE